MGNIKIKETMQDLKRTGLRYDESLDVNSALWGNQTEKLKSFSSESLTERQQTNILT